MNVNPAGAHSGDITVRDLLSSLTALQVLSMVMTDSRGEEEILDLAVSALPSLSHHCRAEGVWLDGQWRSVGSLRGPVDPAAGLDAQLVGLSSAGGALQVPYLSWAWAFPLSSRGGASGYLVVGSLEPPPEHEWSLIQALAQQTGVALANARLLARERAARAQIADEQATLRRVATLVASAAPPEEVFAAVAAEAGRSREADIAVMSRYTEDGTATVVGAWVASDIDQAFQIGTRLEDAENSLHSLVLQTGQPARTDDYTTTPGPVADAAHGYGLHSAVGVPIHIEGRLWGVIALASTREEPLPSDTEAWLAGFTELVATAIANAQARLELRASAEDQAGLRRVATLVATGARPTEVFAAVAAEVGRLLDAGFTVLSRYESDSTHAVVGAWGSTADPLPLPVGTRVPLWGRNAATLVFETGRPARIDDYADSTGPVTNVAHAHGVRASVGVPITVEGRLWGVMIAASREEPLPANTAARLVGFTELVGTAIANAQARVELRSHADEQAALRRVATLVARAAAPEEVFAAVAAEVGRVLSPDVTNMNRFDPDDAHTAVGAWSNTGTPVPFPVGTRTPLGGRNVISLVFDTGRPARMDDFADASGATGEIARGWGARSVVGVPISVEGRLWGVMCVGSGREPLPADTEERLAAFTELVATAIANAQARMELRSHAEEQAALRRVATLVARAAPAEEVFAAVAAEVGRLLEVDYTGLGRYEPDGAVTFVGIWSSTGTALPVPSGTRVDLGGRNATTLVFQTGRPARDDVADFTGPVIDLARQVGIRTSVGVPINVDGRLWGVVTVSSRQSSLPADTEARLAGFTELVATALANAEVQTALTASRARIVAAADTTRRRIERDLHDGAQQRLISLALQLRATQQASSPAEAGELAAQMDLVANELIEVLDELREIARGIHPVALAEGGLRPALKELARRSAVPVRIDVDIDQRLPEPIELAAYYVVAEALTNTAKHAHASEVEIRAQSGEGMLRVSVRDDGRGGADFARGTGLVGLKDRVEALGGRILLDSPRGAGTSLRVELPLTAATGGTPG